MISMDDMCSRPGCVNPTDDGEGNGERGHCGTCADAIENARRAASDAAQDAALWEAFALTVQAAFIALTDAVDRLDDVSETRNGRAGEYVPDQATDNVREQVFRTAGPG